MNTLPAWMTDLQTPLPGETSGKHISRILRALIGLSLKNHADQLAQLFLVNEKPGRAAQISAVTTNCGTSMREVWCLAGCKDHFVTQEYQNGMAVTWDLEAARETGMLISLHDNPDTWKMIDEGWGLHYAIRGTNDDHMEFALGKPDPKTGMCEHAGGGRQDNAITRSVGDIRFSLGRPLQHVIRPDGMSTAGEAKKDETPVPVTVTVPDPFPQPAPLPSMRPELPTHAEVMPPLPQNPQGKAIVALVVVVVAGAIVAAYHGCAG